MASATLDLQWVSTRCVPEFSLWLLDTSRWFSDCLISDGDAHASVVDLLHLDIQRHKRKSVVGRDAAWVRDMASFSDGEHGDQPQ